MAANERASADYERPAENVAHKPDPVTLETNKARQAENRGNMGKVLTIGIALVVAAFVIIYIGFFGRA
jgi:hypothetical protein